MRMRKRTVKYIENGNGILWYKFTHVPHLAVPNSLGVIKLPQEGLAEFLRPVVLQETHHRLRQQLAQDTPLHDIRGLLLR